MVGIAIGGALASPAGNRRDGHGRAGSRPSQPAKRNTDIFFNEVSLYC
jgi:hypothetical protein